MTKQEALEILDWIPTKGDEVDAMEMAIEALARDVINCKDCKYFTYDYVAKVDGVPLIVAHEICTRWSDGVKTSENGYCFLGERGEQDDNTGSDSYAV